MPSFRYNTPPPHALLLLATGLLAIIPILQLLPATAARLDVCYIRRELERPPAPLIPLRDSALHDYSVYIMWAAMLILCLLPNKRTKAVFTLVLTSLWFHITYILLAALKAPLQDLNCAGRHVSFPNGISGHYCYFVFVALSAPLLASRRLEDNPSVRVPIFALVVPLLALFTAGAFATLYRTFFHGYHSLRQILIGTALGIFSHVGLVEFHFSKERPIKSSIAFLAANSASSILLYFAVWPPTSVTVPALPLGQFKFHAVLWGLLLALVHHMPDQADKEAKD